MSQKKKSHAADGHAPSRGHDQRGGGKPDSLDLPVGTASPRAMWPLIVCGLLWSTWVGFLIFLAVDALRET